MQLRNISVILLALLLAGMVMVPMVNAEETLNVNLQKETQIPQLQFEKNSKSVSIDDELVLDAATDSAKIASTIQDSEKPAIKKIPFGAVVYHAKDGMTSVFDATGKQLFAIEDSASGMVMTPAGLSPATHVMEVPSGSNVQVEGGITKVTLDNTRILTIIDETTRTISPMSVSNWPWPYIEGAEAALSGSAGEFTAQWTVPSNPPQTVSGPPGSSGSQVMLWNGVHTTTTPYKLIQPVLEWHKKDYQSDPNPQAAWSIASWFAYPAGFVHSTRQYGIYSGDSIQGQMTYSTSYATWDIRTKDLTRNINSYLSVSNSMPNTNVEIMIMLEGVGLTNNNHVCGDTTFNSFTVKNTNGASIRPSSVTTGVNPTGWWTGKLSGLSVTNNWPNSLILNTAN